MSIRYGLNYGDLYGEGNFKLTILALFPIIYSRYIVWIYYYQGSSILGGGISVEFLILLII
jgi:hypothetical protein